MKNRGITLIALVITIIVLLILAGVTISLVIGDNGLLNKAQTAGETYKKEAAREKLQLKITDLQMGILQDEKREATLIDLKEKFSKDKEITKVVLDNETNPTIATVVIDGYTFYVDDKLRIIDGIEGEEGIKWEYGFTGDVQEFVVPETGNYEIECWGASSNSSAGGYTRGKIRLEKGTKLYLYAGGMSDSIMGGYNGGGNSGSYGYDVHGGAGATDIRLIKGEANEFTSLKSRIMVAAGAGEVATSSQQIPNAGGLTGYDSRTSGLEIYGGKGGKQTQGGELASNYSGIAGLTPGGFGTGGNGNRARDLGFGGGRRWRILRRFWRKRSTSWWLWTVAVVPPIFQDMLVAMQ